MRNAADEAMMAEIRERIEALDRDIKDTREMNRQTAERWKAPERAREVEKSTAPQRRKLGSVFDGDLGAVPEPDPEHRFGIRPLGASGPEGYMPRYPFPIGTPVTPLGELHAVYGATKSEALTLGPAVDAVRADGRLSDEGRAEKVAELAKAALGRLEALEKRLEVPREAIVAAAASIVLVEPLKPEDAAGATLDAERRAFLRELPAADRLMAARGDPGLRTAVLRAPELSGFIATSVDLIAKDAVEALPPEKREKIHRVEVHAEALSTVERALWGVIEAVRRATGRAK